jgi:hypothetical protein
VGAACALASFLLLGGAAYVFNLVCAGHLVPPSKPNFYGDWKNLWMFPYLAFARPLSPVNASWVPWRHEYWVWPQWDIHFSTYGLQSTVALLALPVAVARYWRAGRAAERALASVAALLAWVATLPVGVDGAPVGWFEGIIRYTLFLPPIVLCWVAAPSVQERAASAATLSVARGLTAGCAAIFAYMAIAAAVCDRFAPLPFVGHVYADPTLSRAILAWSTDLSSLYTGPVRAASWVDAHASPTDTVALDGAFDSWIYPAYGADLRREVVFLHSERGQPVSIPATARWVVIDRVWNCEFGHPLFRDFAVTTLLAYVFRGSPLPEDLIVYRQLATDPHFVLRYRDARTNQAVFERVQ